ncbi:MAG: UDP-N-acetylmuramoyl-tripeptide--D-alanyl-D-alanine ligase [Actinomycetia bacterium]|nr:UDP-N-acetylmuramoyl-tripeptide--D-alanyl-D-alanine ligase [Actinomycetes bacterium]
MTILLCLLLAAAVPIADARWLRVGQREHYLAGSVSQFARRWWTVDWRNVSLGIAALLGLVVSIWFPLAAVVSIEAAALGPIGLSMRGRTSRLAWTRRLKSLASVHTLIIVTLGVLGIVLGVAAPVLAATAISLPLTLDVALALVSPIERRAARGFVDAAVAKLDRVGPTRVAITGSYGKTSIKGYVRHIADTTLAVVASPASFNNTGGLSRTVNEHLAPDTEVFVAEMGTYGPGEIRDLCSWVKPDIAALCNIGPVHLERFGSLDNVVESKSEIFEGASTAVLNIDAYRLGEVADRLRGGSLKVITASADPDSDADVRVFAATHSQGRRVCIGDDCDTVSTAPDSIDDNVAVAVAIAHALGIANDTIRSRLATLPGAGHRRERSISPTGVTIIDDTYNSNPAGAAAALDVLESIPSDRRVVVTPGMVEMGPQQAAANEEFARHAATVADDILVVGETNRAALHAGASAGTATLTQTRTRTEAVEWVRRNLGPGDAVLYENDLPDHYP